jgi:hypothetical protein
MQNEKSIAPCETNGIQQESEISSPISFVHVFIDLIKKNSFHRAHGGYFKENESFITEFILQAVIKNASLHLFHVLLSMTI